MELKFDIMIAFYATYGSVNGVVIYKGKHAHSMYRDIPFCTVLFLVCSTCPFIVMYCLV